uniref:Uncharacterized protein n=1 Tax=Lymantria dispar multicapsid nuclear polyhedrosis virus TaxID=10449 RepID=A0A1D8QNC0_NPVLD|nr:hypothetical protein [Lymantria dispar multiple nucleopolyhedrovirus]
MRQIHTHTTQIPLENTKFISASTDLAMRLCQKCFSPNFKNSILISASVRSISRSSRAFFVMRLILSQCSILMASRFLV